MAKYVEVLTQNEQQLQEFYNGGRMIMKRNVSDARKAREAESVMMTDRILNMVGGSVGRRRSDEEKLVIGVGLGQFPSQHGLTSLHTSFLSYFVRTARALKYVVVGANEFYTSKKCPDCKNFLCQVNIRRLYRSVCKVFMHRDVAGGHNIANVLRGHLMDQARPTYLQPIDREVRNFLAQSKRPKFDPSEYIENRAIKTPKAAQKLRGEWEALIKDLSSSKHAVVSEVAKTARPMTATDLDKYYKIL